MTVVLFFMVFPVIRRHFLVYLFINTFTLSLPDIIWENQYNS